MDYSGAALLRQGAESKVYKGEYFGKQAVFKERFVKTYRHPELDRQLTRERIKAEARGLRRCRIAGIPVPTVYFIDLTSRLMVMSYLENSVTLRDAIADIQKSSSNEGDSRLALLMHRTGEVIALMHKDSVIHGDLTTSNLIVQQLGSTTPIVSVIDFGLSFISETPEDKGVDLYVLERAFLSTHPGSEVLFEGLLKSYAKSYGLKANAIMKKFDEVKQRGRKRTMVG